MPAIVATGVLLFLGVAGVGAVASAQDASPVRDYRLDPGVPQAFGPTDFRSRMEWGERMASRYLTNDMHPGWEMGAFPAARTPTPPDDGLPQWWNESGRYPEGPESPPHAGWEMGGGMRSGLLQPPPLPPVVLGYLVWLDPVTARAEWLGVIVLYGPGVALIPI